MEAGNILPQSILGRFSNFDSKHPEFFVPPIGVIRAMDEIVEGSSNESFKTYKLKDATSFFAEAMKYKLAQMAIERWIDQDDGVFLVVGCRISSNGRIDSLEVQQVSHKWVEAKDVIQSDLTKEYVSWKAFVRIRSEPEMAFGVKLGTLRSAKQWDTTESGRIEEMHGIRGEDIDLDDFRYAGVEKQINTSID